MTAVVTVWCARHRHRVGAVSRRPDGTHELTVEGFRYLRQEWLVDGAQGEPDGIIHRAPRTTYLLTVEGQPPCRCRCSGLQTIDPAEIRAAVAAAKSTGKKQDVRARLSFMLHK